MMKLFMENKWDIYLALLLFVVMVMAVVPSSATAATTTAAMECKHSTDMWGDPNPNIFYVCDEVRQMPLQLECPKGRGFFNGFGYSGCIPYADWPACRPTAEAVAKELAAGCDSSNSNSSSSSNDDDEDNNDETGALTVTHLHQPWATLDPNAYYMCPGIAATPVMLSCVAGKGFVHTTDVVGCADWSLWRIYMNCESYY